MDHEATAPDSYYVQGALEFHSLSSYGEFPEPFRPALETIPTWKRDRPLGAGPSLAAVADML